MLLSPLLQMPDQLAAYSLVSSAFFDDEAQDVDQRAGKKQFIRTAVDIPDHLAALFVHKDDIVRSGRSPSDEWISDSMKLPCVLCLASSFYPSSHCLGPTVWKSCGLFGFKASSMRLQVKSLIGLGSSSLAQYRHSRISGELG